MNVFAEGPENMKVPIGKWIFWRKEKKCLAE